MDSKAQAASKRKPGMRRLLVAIALSIILVATGVLLLIVSNNRQDDNLKNEYDKHLIDIACSIDKGAAIILNRYNAEMASVLNSTDLASMESQYLKTGDELGIKRCFEDSAIFKEGLVSCVLASWNGEMLFSAGNTSPTGLGFLADDYDGTLSICKDAQGVIYVGKRYSRDGSDITYTLLVKVIDFYDAVVPASVTQNCWAVLYEPSKDIFLQSDTLYNSLEIMTEEEAAARSDGYSFLAEHSDSDSVQVGDYVFHDISRNTSTQACTAVVPKNLTENGLFAIGVSLDVTPSITAAHVIWMHVFAGIVLILTGIGLTVVMLVLRSKKLEALSQEVALINERQKATESLLEKQHELVHAHSLQVLGEMTGSIAHEFNNLLTPIMGYSLLCIEQAPEDNQELNYALSEIYQSAEKAKDVISRLSNLTRKTSGRSYVALNPDSQVQRILEIAAPSKPENVLITTDFGCGDVTFWANETQVCQALLNVIINAFAALGDNGGTVTIHTQHQEESVWFVVSDTGPGIPDEIMEKIFDPYFTTKGAGVGTGLGLPIVEQITKNHDGWAKAENNPDGGCRLTLCFALLPSNAEDDGHHDGKGPSDQDHGDVSES